MGRLGGILLLGSILFMASGCATTRRDADLEIQGLRNQVSLLDAQAQSKDEEISRLNNELARLGEQAQPPAKVKEVTLGGAKEEPFVRPSVKEVQTALKNAGYKVGRIDGAMGKRTRSAVKAFQAANNLPVNGKVGKKTWELLKGYLLEKNSAAQPATIPKEIG